MSVELEQARRVAVALEQQVALLTAYAEAVAFLHDGWTDAEVGWADAWCHRCGERWPCPERVEADRVLLAVSAVEPADPS